MAHSTQRTYRVVVVALLLVMLVVVGVVGVILMVNWPLSASDVAATLTALPSLTPTVTSTPTPVPTLSGVTEELLVCQREAGRAMNARGMVGTVNIADDHLFLLSWISLEWQVEDLDDALAGVVMGFDVALDVWDRGCAVFDQVEIVVYDRRNEQQVRQLDVRASMDDLLKWRAKELSDTDLVARLQVQKLR